MLFDLLIESSMKQISFCITCKNRLHQISKTLLKNLDDNRSMSEFIEFVLVDFGSTDGLKDWIIANFSEDVKTGYLNFFYTKELPNFHASVAKNTSHKLAKGKIVVNLDCDNFTGIDGGLYILSQFSTYGTSIVLHQGSVDPTDGSFGRISMLKKYFLAIGGYDESFHPMAYQDKDLIHRSVEFGLFYTIKDDPKYNKAISNLKDESILYTNSSTPYFIMVRENRLLSLKNIREGNIIVNNGLPGIKKKIRKLIIKDD